MNSDRQISSFDAPSELRRRLSAASSRRRYSTTTSTTGRAQSQMSRLRPKQQHAVGGAFPLHRPAFARYANRIFTTIHTYAKMQAAHSTGSTHPLSRTGKSHVIHKCTHMQRRQRLKTQCAFWSVAVESAALRA